MWAIAMLLNSKILLTIMIWRILPRKVLMAVEEKDFPEVWITFVRGFNRLTNDRGLLRVLREQSRILNGLVVKKFKSLPKGELKEAIAAVSAELQFIGEQLRTIDEQLETTPFLAFMRLKGKLGKTIRQAQAVIRLAYSCQQN